MNTAIRSIGTRHLALAEALLSLKIEPFLYRGYESDPRLMVDSRRIIGWLAQAHPAAFAGPELSAPGVAH